MLLEACSCVHTVLLFIIECGRSILCAQRLVCHLFPFKAISTVEGCKSSVCAHRAMEIYLRIKLPLLRKQGSIERRGICKLHFSRETPAGGSSCVPAAWAAKVWRGHSRPGS